MTRLLKSLAVVVALATAVSCETEDEYKTYSGYQLLRVVPDNLDQLYLLKDLEQKYNELDFWKDPVLNSNVDINVPPALLEFIKYTFNTNGVLYEVIFTDIQQLIERNTASPPELRRLSSVLSDLQGADQQAVPLSAVTYDIVGRFPRHDELLQWLTSMAASFPSLAQTEDIGTTYEGRTQRLIKIGAATRSGVQKPIIWVDSAIHAREWLTVGTTVWIINKMLTTYNTDQTVRELMDYYDWYFLPVANPDGYEYTHTSDRLWRKTRSRNTGSTCFGTDPNRNWGYKWMASGTSTSPCSQTYGGPSAFSEKCVQNMRDAILRYAPRIKYYMGVHSYSQMWLTPWAWGGSKPADYADLERVANSGNTALRNTNGVRFVVGTPPDILYAASGGAYDWAKAVAGIKYAYTFELRPDGNAYNGFVVPESTITPSGQEVWAALAQNARDIMSG